MSIQKLGDPKAVPHLAKIIEQPMTIKNYDSDALHAFVGLEQLVVDCCFVLASFIGIPFCSDFLVQCTFFRYVEDENAKTALLNGISRPHTRDACLVALYISTGDDLFLKQIWRILANGKPLSSGIINHLMYPPYKSERASTILVLNQRFSVQMQSNNDDSDISDD